MQVVARGAAGVADVGDHLPGLYLLALGDADLAAMGIKGLQAAAVVDLDIVAVAAALSRALATVTVPSAAARIGVPSGAAMSVPSW